MAGAGFGIDATRCRPALDPTDCRRGPNIEKPSRLTCALTRLHDRQCPDPKVPGVSPCHRYPRCCLRRHTNLICESKGIPCDSSDSHQAESALEALIGLASIPAPRSELESDLFDALTIIYPEPRLSERARNAVRRAFGEQTFETFAAYLAFIRTAHYWTETPPELAYEPDIAAVMQRHPDLAALLLDQTEAKRVAEGEAL